MSVENEFTVEITRAEFNKKIAPMIASGKLRKYETGWDITYLCDQDTGLNVACVGERGDIWRAWLSEYWANKLEGVES
jgi:hypothetical protein